MNQICNIINYIFNSCFNNKQKKYNINLSKYKNYKFIPKLEIIYEDKNEDYRV
jgi:hypothetical protein